MPDLKIFNYNDNSIEFEVINGEVFANATAMCKAFGKKPINWLRSVQTERYMNAIKAKCENLTLVETRQGGDNSGTWIHEKLILKLAQWLDVDFEIWCDEKVSELLRTGKVELKPKTQIELIIESAMALQQHESRLSDVEIRLNQIEETKQIALSELNHIERSTNEVPEIGLRLKINQIVRAYGEKTSISYSDIWRSMYSKMLYSYRFNVNGYKKLYAKESKMDIVERENQLDNLFALVSRELI